MSGEGKPPRPSGRRRSRVEITMVASPSPDGATIRPEDDAVEFLGVAALLLLDADERRGVGLRELAVEAVDLAE